MSQKVILVRPCKVGLLGYALAGTNLDPLVLKHMFYTSRKVFSTWLVGLSMFTWIDRFQVNPRPTVTSLDINTICEPPSNKHSSWAIQLITTYINLSGLVDFATIKSLGTTFLLHFQMKCLDFIGGRLTLVSPSEKLPLPITEDAAVGLNVA